MSTHVESGGGWWRADDRKRAVREVTPMLHDLATAPWAPADVVELAKVLPGLMLDPAADARTSDALWALNQVRWTLVWVCGLRAFDARDGALSRVCGALWLAMRGEWSLLSGALREATDWIDGAPRWATT